MTETRVDTEERFVWVDLETGEQVQESPALVEARVENRMLERDLTTKRKRISELEGKREEKARKHRLWDEIEAVYDWYRLATGHFDMAFEADEFNEALPRWKENAKGKANPCKPALRAICGIAYDPNTTKGRNGEIRKYDSWELLNRNKWKWPDFQARVPGETDQDWWCCLMELIKGNLR